VVKLTFEELTHNFPSKFGSFSFDREQNKNMKDDGITFTHLRRLIFIGASMRQKKDYFEAKKNSLIES
jgi:hypothetical protein